MFAEVESQEFHSCENSGSPMMASGPDSGILGKQPAVATKPEHVSLESQTGDWMLLKLSDWQDLSGGLHTTLEPSDVDLLAAKDWLGLIDDLLETSPPLGRSKRR